MKIKLLLISIFIFNDSQIIRSIARVDRAQALESPANRENRAIIREIKVTGSTVFTPEELQKIVAPYLDREINPLVLEEIRQILALYYTERGYITSGAYLPPQNLSSGIIEVRIVEGKTILEVEGLERIEKKYFLARLPLNPPLNVKELEAAIELLQRDPLFEEIQADLRAGSKPNTSILILKVKEAPNYNIGLRFDNYESPLIGEYQGTIAFSSNNFFGFADSLNLSYGFTEGVDKVSVGYSLPINSEGGKIAVGYSSGETLIVENFQELGIRSQSNRFQVEIRQPLVSTLEEEFSLSLGFDVQNSQSFILNTIPFSFSEGAQEGKSKVVALRFGQDWVSRSEDQIFIARSTFGIGLAAFGATDNNEGIDGQFFSWQGQVQFLQKLDEKIFLQARSSLQLTPDEVLTVEKFELGGIETVRGYRRNILLGDEGLNASVQVNFVPTDWLTISPFVDFGTIWGTDLETETIASLGLSLKAQSDWGFLRIDYAVPLVDVEEGDSLQENGLSIGAGLTVKF